MLVQSAKTSFSNAAKALKIKSTTLNSDFNAPQPLQ